MVRIYDGSFSLWQRGGTIAEISFETLDSLWEYPDPEGTMKLHGGFLCVGTLGNGDVAILDPRTGTMRRRPLPPLPPGLELSHVHHHHQDLYCRFSGSQRIAIDLRTDRTVWRHLETPPDPIASSWLQHRAGTIVYGVEPLMQAVDLDSGGILWERSAGALNQTVTLGYERLYVGTLLNCASSNCKRATDRLGMWRRGRDSHMLARHPCEPTKPGARSG